MPLPIAHCLLGASIVAAAHPRGREPKILLAAAVLANAPDGDLVLLWVFGIRGMHRTFSHSVAGALLLTTALLMILGRRQLRAATAFGLAYLSHGLLDMV